MENIPREALLLPFILLILVFVLRARVVWLREARRFSYRTTYSLLRSPSGVGSSAASRPLWIQGKPAGSWATLVLEQIDVYDYYTRYLPQIALAICIAALNRGGDFPVKRAALILLGTARSFPIYSDGGDGRG